ncbi:MAG: ArdC family protein [Gammaproteobacteria bacterium]|nr:ArdC family protein [Gammaproteobacteria bacterium]
MNYTDLATAVTQQLVTQIETGPGAWRMPWHTVPGLFDVRNASTSNRYRTGACGVFELGEWGSGSGVGGPVPAGESDPFRGLPGADADRFGQQRWGDLGGELGDGGCSVGSGVDADAAEPVGDRGRVDRPIGSGGGEQPAGLEMIRGALLAADWELAGEAGEGFGQIDLVALERDRDLAVAGFGELINTEPGDAGHWLGVENHEGACDAVVGAEGVVVDEAAGNAPSELLIDTGGQLAGAAGGGDVELGSEVSLVCGPVEERGDQRRSGSGRREPVVHIDLATISQGAVLVVEAVDESADGAGLLA